jgi:Uma2 family endonuclease
MEDVRYELLDGEMIRLTSSNEAHQRILLELAFALMSHVREHRLGQVYIAPFDVVLGPPGEEEVAEPDILFVSKERDDIIRKDAVHGAPDLVVEILSPSTKERDKNYKRKMYAKYGVKEYWLIDPEAETIELLALARKSYERVALYKKTETLISQLLTELKVSLKEIF